VWPHEQGYDDGVVWPHERTPEQQRQENERINSIFEESFKNIGTFRKGSRDGARRR